MTKPTPINREKASSHPLKPGSFYTGVVTYVAPSGQVNVTIDILGMSFEKVTPVGTTPLNKLKKNDKVACCFINEFFTDVIVFGPSIIKPDVFAAKTVVDSLVTQVASLEARVSALEAE